MVTEEKTSRKYSPHPIQSVPLRTNDKTDKLNLSKFRPFRSRNISRLQVAILLFLLLHAAIYGVKTEKIFK